MITERDIEAAVNYLHHEAAAAAEARAQAEHLDDMKSVILARLAGLQNETSEAAKDRAAKSHPEYAEFLEGLRAARVADYTHRNKRAAAMAKLDFWRSLEASKRGADRVG